MIVMMFFRCLTDNGIMPCIKVRKNAKVKKTNHYLEICRLYHRGKMICKEWKDNSVRYGQRWIFETVFSCIKRMFGEYVYSIKSKEYDTGNDVKSILYNQINN